MVVMVSIIETMLAQVPVLRQCPVHVWLISHFCSLCLVALVSYKMHAIMLKSVRAGKNPSHSDVSFSQLQEEFGEPMQSAKIADEVARYALSPH